MPKPFDHPIYVTQPFLPNLEDFCTGLKEIWDNKWLTNNGPVLQRYTKKIIEYFESDNVCLFNNDTLAVQIGLQGMGRDSGKAYQKQEKTIFRAGGILLKRWRNSLNSQ